MSNNKVVDHISCYKFFLGQIIWETFWWVTLKNECFIGVRAFSIPTPEECTLFEGRSDSEGSSRKIGQGDCVWNYVWTYKHINYYVLL
jgi:hypothetical protein